jgi:hypothetical protein
LNNCKVFLERIGIGIAIRELGLSSGKVVKTPQVSDHVLKCGKMITSMAVFDITCGRFR